MDGVNAFNCLCAPYFSGPACEIAQPIEFTSVGQSAPSANGCVVSLSVDVTGIAPLSFAWSASDGAIVPGSTAATSSTATWTAPATYAAGVASITVQVTDAIGATAAQTFSVAQGTLDTSNEALNCGTCGRDCLGGACDAGMCLATPLATGLVNPAAITLDAEDVYWANLNGGDIRKVSKTGGPNTVLSSGHRHPEALAVADGTVYFVVRDLNDDNFGEIWSVPSAGGARTLLSGSEAAPITIAVDATHVYWGNQVAPLGVYSLPRSGGTPQLVAQAGPVFSLLVSDGRLFYDDDGVGQLRSVAVTGGSITTLASVFQSYLAIDESYVYMAMRPYAYLAKVPRGGGAEIPISNTEPNPGDVQVDASHVYWSTNSGTTHLIKRMSKADGSITTLTSLSGVSTNQINRLAIDDTWVFFTVNGFGDGRVMRVAK